MSRNSTDSIEPAYLAGQEEELSYIKQQSRGPLRVKLERGHSWKVRFLPAQLGPARRWYARIAKHWSGQKPIVCPRHTHLDYGGDPEAACPVCDVAERMNENHSKAIADLGYKLTAGAQWTTYALVFAKSTGGPFQNVADDELSRVYVFDHYKSTYEELVAFVRNGATKSRPLSVLDYVAGNDFVVTRTGKGLKLDKQDPEPVFDPNDPNFDAFIQKIEAQMKTPVVQIPTLDELEEFAGKAEEFAFKSAHTGGGDSSRGRGAAAGFNETDDRHTDDAPADDHQEPAAAPRRGAAPAAVPAARRAPATAPAAAAPAPRAAAPAPAARPAAPAPRAQAPAPAARPAAPAPASTRGAAPAARPAPAPAARASAPAPRAAAPAPAIASSVDEQEDNLPEETVDQAPPGDQPVEEVLEGGDSTGPVEGAVDPGEATEGAGEEQPQEPEQQPPPVAARGALSNSLKSKIAAARQQEAKR